ncbi:hypothetical protein BJX61DRAFT_529111 [Aspergillus egyptiacus]|nr:hypothetical protein BJX61DRAFT_529111 [Aspergillus egyptiacus]
MYLIRFKAKDGTKGTRASFSYLAASLTNRKVENIYETGAVTQSLRLRCWSAPSYPGHLHAPSNGQNAVNQILMTDTWRSYSALAFGYNRPGHGRRSCWKRNTLPVFTMLPRCGCRSSQYTCEMHLDADLQQRAAQPSPLSLAVQAQSQPRRRMRDLRRWPR